MARKALKMLMRRFSWIVYTERVGSSNLSPPTSLRWANGKSSFRSH